jgi:tetratricopeptide (TPR) repeat protein
LPAFLPISLAFSVLAFVCGGQDSSDLARAQRLAKEGSTGAAIEAYASWLQAHPADRAALREAATFAFRTRRWFESAQWLERLVALDPSDPSSWFDLGTLRHNQCRFDLAIPAFRHLDSLESTDPSLAARAEHRFLHGESARRLDIFGEAIAELQLATARAPDRSEYKKALAQALLDGGRFGPAAAAFSDAVRSDPSADNFYGLGAALAESGKAGEALSALKEANRLKPGDGRTLLKLGTLMTQAKDFGRAEAYLAQARAAAPRNVEVAFALAQVQRLGGRAEEAEKTRAAAEELKKEADALVERGRMFHRGLVSNPTDGAAHLKYALDLLEQSRLDDAQIIFQRLLSFDPLNRLAILNLASLLTRQGDTAGALAELRKLLEKNEGDEAANMQAAHIKLAMRDPSGAIDHLRRAAATNPRNVDAHRLFAIAWQALGNAEEAARHEAIRKQLAGVESAPAKD